ncbi:MAG: hypothetical protein A3F12_07655 [Gammaproteobacteria bacterium RIFCSPHIGHO2_12_FULL_38_14]|nr:MAG: hypothetical protein A3F12_07655 [Gammaproteobacteria bacterium RIFCSPHIGHO2_12_FULL_38_14]
MFRKKKPENQKPGISFPLFTKEKEIGKKKFLDELMRVLCDEGAMLAAINYRTSICKGGNLYRDFTINELDKALREIDFGEATDYTADMGRVGEQLREIGFSTNEQSRIKKSVLIRCEAAVFSAQDATMKSQDSITQQSSLEIQYHTLANEESGLTNKIRKDRADFLRDLSTLAHPKLWTYIYKPFNFISNDFLNAMKGPLKTYTEVLIDTLENNKTLDYDLRLEILKLVIQRHTKPTKMVLDKYNKIKNDIYRSHNDIILILETIENLFYAELKNKHHKELLQKNPELSEIEALFDSLDEINKRKSKPDTQLFSLFNNIIVELKRVYNKCEDEDEISIKKLHNSLFLFSKILCSDWVAPNDFYKLLDEFFKSSEFNRNMKKLNEELYNGLCLINPGLMKQFDEISNAGAKLSYSQHFNIFEPKKMYGDFIEQQPIPNDTKGNLGLETKKKKQ